MPETSVSRYENKDRLWFILQRLAAGKNPLAAIFNSELQYL